MANTKLDRYLTPAVPHLIPEDELTGEQIDRQDEVDNATHAFINEMIPPQYREILGEDESQIEWDIESMHQVRELVETIIWDKLDLNAHSRNASDSQTRREQFEMNFYPFLKPEE